MNGLLKQQAMLVTDSDPEVGASATESRQVGAPLIPFSYTSSSVESPRSVPIVLTPLIFGTLVNF